MLYSLLEIKQRYHISGYFNQVIVSFLCDDLIGYLLPDADMSLEMYKEKIQAAFSSRWAKHKCDKPG